MPRRGYPRCLQVLPLAPSLQSNHSPIPVWQGPISLDFRGLLDPGWA